MLQVQCVRIPVLEGRMAKLREWIDGLSGRRPEVLEALESEGVADEAVFLGSEGDRDYLYLYSRSASVAAAGAAFDASRLSVDVEFKRLMAECLELQAAEPLILLFAADRGGGWVRS